MAKRKTNSKPRRVSRREVLLMAPAAFVIAGGDPRGDQGGIPCGPVELYVGPTGAGPVLGGIMCCDDGDKVFVDGHDRVKSTTKEHLQPLRDELDKRRQNQQLLEYCVIVWGLTKGDREKVVQQLRLSPYKK